MEESCMLIDLPLQYFNFLNINNSNVRALQLEVSCLGKIVSVAQWFLVAWWSLWLGLQKLYLLNFLSLFDWLGIPHVFGIFLIPSLSPMTCQFSLLKHGFPGWTLWLLVCFLLSGLLNIVNYFQSHRHTHTYIFFFSNIFSSLLCVCCRGGNFGIYSVHCLILSKLNF